MKKLMKIKVTTGVYWVEVPEAKLYVLCGCPADTVKHLMKRGLIATREIDGVTFETGPNTILLSDILVQNSRFANLAEFPLLQMLYRQGLILPGHPNNTGAKPLIIGSKHQVEAQKQYIFRGNYGLISKEEIMASGMSPKAADIIMRMKLKFAFGKIKSTDELLDTLVIADEPVEIKNGVFVKRTSFNVFEFRYGEETVSVDLNLDIHESYGLPFSLGFHNIKRDYFQVIHSGEGDGWDSNRQCVSSIIVFQGKVYLIDAGPNFNNSLTSLGISVNEIEGIFHTHSHDDHFCGIPTLMRTDRRLKYFATPLVRASVTKKISALLSMDEEAFSDYFDVHDLKFDTWNDIEGLEVKPILSPHPVETNIFIFRALWHDGYHSYAHYEDLTSFDVLENMVTDDDSAHGISRDFFEKVQKDYLTEVNLKKLDIGGGMIHGQAEDFRQDKSKKIFLTHIPRDLTDSEKEIGSGAPFGTFEVMIPTHQNYARQYAFNYLRDYFPSVPPRKLAILLNNPVVTFNPESIIIRGGVAYKEIYIILTGNVEFIRSDSNVNNMLSAGAFIGEIKGLFGIPSKATYRAASFVRALKLHANLYFEFVKQNKLHAEINRLRANEEFLQDTWLFGEAISYPVQHDFAASVDWRKYPADHEFSVQDNTELMMVKTGQLTRSRGDVVVEVLKKGDFFGEEGLIQRKSGLVSVRTTEASQIGHFPGEKLVSIPIIRWKLFETYEKRIRSLRD